MQLVFSVCDDHGIWRATSSKG